MRKARVLLIVLVSVALLGTSATGAPSLAKRRLTVGTVTNSWNEWLPQWVAMQKGFYASEGLEIKPSYVSPAPTLMAALLAGSVDITVNLSNDTVFRAVDRGADAPRIIAGYNETLNYVVFVRPDIRSAADLRGKRVGIDQPSGPIDLMTRVAIKSLGLDPDKDVSLVPVGNAPQRSAALMGGSVSAVVSTLPDEPILEDNGMKVLVELRTVYPDYSFGSIVASKTLLERNPDTVEAFLRATIRGMQYIRRADPKELEEIVKAQGGSVREKYFKEELGLLLETVTADGSVNLRGLAAVARLFKGLGLLKDNFDYNNILALRFLRQAWKDLGIR